jgi:hypothetical protein
MSIVLKRLSFKEMLDPLVEKSFKTMTNVTNASTIAAQSLDNIEDFIFGSTVTQVCQT